MDKRLKITIGIPSSTEFLHRHFVESLINLKYPEKTDVQFCCVYGLQLPFARNRIVDEALENNSDYLLFLDADMIFPPDLLTRLVFHNVDIVNALAFRRIEPHYPCIFKWNENEHCYETMTYYGGLQEVDACGMCSILIRMDVFRKLKKPWYYYRDNLFSSDLTFCENCRKEGFKVYVDTDLKIGHLGAENVITEEYYLAHLSPEAKEQWNQGIRDIVKTEMREKKLFHD
jgi:glycosyltransferase involved in cell wall biosynthesis